MDQLTSFSPPKYAQAQQGCCRSDRKYPSLSNWHSRSVRKTVLEREHRIYMHLHSAEVKGILRSFGLFVDDKLIEDSEGPYALVITFAGDSLSHRASKVSTTTKYVRSPIQISFGRLISVRFCKKSLLATLKSIHKAGVIHGDIRLTNLCVNDAGKAFIID
jgi:serine/threonine protein kinase